MGSEMCIRDRTDASETHPNVLFILDTSGSMNVRDAGANKRTARMTVLKKAMADLLTTLDNVNIGLARFSDAGGSVIFLSVLLMETQILLWVSKRQEKH